MSDRPVQRGFASDQRDRLCRENVTRLHQVSFAKQAKGEFSRSGCRFCARTWSNRLPPSPNARYRLL